MVPAIIPIKKHLSKKHTLIPSLSRLEANPFNLSAQENLCKGSRFSTDNISA